MPIWPCFMYIFCAVADAAARAICDNRDAAPGGLPLVRHWYFLLYPTTLSCICCLFAVYLIAGSLIVATCLHRASAVPIQNFSGAMAESGKAHTKAPSKIMGMQNGTYRLSQCAW